MPNKFVGDENEADALQAFDRATKEAQQPGAGQTKEEAADAWGDENPATCLTTDGNYA